MLNSLLERFHMRLQGRRKYVADYIIWFPYRFGVELHYLFGNLYLDTMRGGFHIHAEIGPTAFKFKRTDCR